VPRALQSAPAGLASRRLRPERPLSAAKPLDFDPIDEARRHWVAHGWGAAAGGMALVTSLVRAQQIFFARIEAELRPLGLTFARYELLMLLSFSRNGSMPLSRAGARLQVHPASITNAVDRLEAQGLLRRLAHGTDRRTTLAEILPAGRELAHRATVALNRNVFERPGLRPEETEQVVSLLRNLRASAGDFSDRNVAGTDLS
jgi:DNA-binding MarR family transcriptional regulator